MIEIERIQTEQREWSRRNFGHNHDVRDPAIGAFEEFGELCDAMHAEYVTDADRAALRAEVEDAIADVFIYLTDYCNRAGWSMLHILTASGGFLLDGAGCVVRPKEQHEVLRRGDVPFRLGSALGRLAHSTLKARQGIRGTFEKHESDAKAAVADAVAILHDAAAFRGVDFASIVEGVWSEVRKRDWTSPKAGA